MTFYLIGLGLNENSLTIEALKALKECSKIYLESYTIDFPYDLKILENKLGRKIIKLNREEVEKEEFLKEAKNHDIALLVYGSPLSATTHYSLISRCNKEGMKYKVVYNGSIFDAVAETGLQLYKFGRTASMPKWSSNGKTRYEPESFADVIKDNLKIKAHTLVLVDIGLEFGEAMEQLINAVKSKKVKIDKIVVCSKLGTNESKIIYADIDKLMNVIYRDNKIKAPFCFIMPSRDFHFTEEEALKRFSIQ